MMERLRYYIHEGFKNIWTNGFMSIASIGVLTICLLLVGSSILVSINVNKLIAQVASKNQIMVYLKDSLDQKGIDNVKQQIESLGNVKDTTFVSRQQALDALKKQFGDQSQLLSGMGNDFLPNAYQVEIYDMKTYSQTARQLRSITGVERVNDNSAVADKLAKIKFYIGLAGIILFLFLGVSSLFLISNNIKLAVFIRRREINIMKFVGATDGFIRWPFVVEGIFIGVISGVLGILLSWLIYEKLITVLFSVLNVTPVNFGAVSAFFWACYVLSGILVGVAGSFISMRRYLKV
jgi:cell division transport system permease protein